MKFYARVPRRHTERPSRKRAKFVIVVIGSTGQVGRSVLALLERQGTGGFPVDRQALDLSSSPESLAPRLGSLLGRMPARPSAVILTAAYTQVDRAESERDLAFRVNAQAPGAIARFCHEEGLPLVHFSTDYVFSGEGDQPWTETSPTAPLCVYGASKLAGEEAIAACGGDHLIFRTSWVYAPTGRNFVRTLLKLGSERETLSVVSDQIGAPTYAPHLVEGALAGLDWALSFPRFPSGIYHLCGQGWTSWHGFATAIFEEARGRGWNLQVREVKAIPSADYPTPAARPLNSRLSLEKTGRILGITLPSWRVGLAQCLDELQPEKKG